MKQTYLNFESEISKIDNQLNELRKLNSFGEVNYSSEITKLEKERVKRIKSIYSNLNSWQIVRVARHPQRPVFQDYLENIVKDFKELHGDRVFGDDKVIVTGFGQIKRNKVMIIGHNKKKKIETEKKIRELKEKYKTLKIKNSRNFEEEKRKIIEEETRCKAGYALPEGYRKALDKMKLAEKFRIPVVTFIDTPGAYPGIGAEERGIARAIAVNLMEMSKLKVPIVSVVIGEGGSGGALGIGVCDKLGMLEFAYYSVISPEGCAAILWRDRKYAPEAAEALKLTSKDLYKLRLIDEIIPEPLGGAHRNPFEIYFSIEQYIDKTLKGLKKVNIKDLLEQRYKKLRKIGRNKIVKSKN